MLTELPIRLLDLEVEIYLRLGCEEAIGSNCREHIHQEVMYAAMAGMHELGYILEHIVYGFYDAPFAQHDLVIEWHQTLFHV